MDILRGTICRVTLVILMCMILIPWQAHAAIEPEQKLTASDGAAYDEFGSALSVSGDTMVIGSQADDDDGARSGSAYIFTRSGGTWTEEAKLTANDGGFYDSFGNAASLSGDTVAISAPGDDQDTGSVYVFTRSGTSWTQQAKLTASDGVSGDKFGISVALDGETLAVSAPFDWNSVGNQAGSIYIYERTGNTWSEQTKIVASDGAGGDYFGWSLSLDGDTLAAGAWRHDEGHQDAGSAYVLTRDGSTWSEQTKLTASDGTQYDHLGFSVSLDKDTLAVGAHHDDVQGFDSGSAYVFTRSGTTWTEQAKIAPADGSLYDYFGISVSVNDDVLAIGAYGDVDYTGSAYVYTRSGASWTEVFRLEPSAGDPYDRFGQSVFLDEDTLAIAAIGDDDVANHAGSVYVFGDSDGDCYTDWEELAEGSDPEDPASIPTALGPVTLLQPVTGDHDPSGQGSCPPY